MKLPRFYIGKTTQLLNSPRPEIIAIVKKVISEPQYKLCRKHIKLISITSIRARGRVTVGRWMALKDNFWSR